MNIGMMLVEVLYGMFAGSLGLVCDGVHMGLNTFSIILSVIAVKWSTTPASPACSLGLLRVHVLAAFSNAVVMVFVAMFLVFESLRRSLSLMSHDVSNHADHVLSVATLGLMMNLIGFVLLGLSTKHSKTVKGENLIHQGSRQGLLLNLKSLLLHATCDIVISVGVIISSLLVRQGWEFMDPFISFLISIVILKSVWPLLLSSSEILLQVSPDSNHLFDKCVREISIWSGVLECNDAHLWAFSPDYSVLTLHVRVRDEVDESDMSCRLHALLSPLARRIAIQIDKDQVCR